LDNVFSAASGTLDYCRVHDITIQAWSPVGRGLLFDPPAAAAPNIHAAAREIAALAEQHQTTREAIALAWLLRHPAGIQPILGTLTPQRIIDSCRAVDVELSRIEWYRLLEAARGKPVP
jgi:predicted oxidoreductase